MADSPWDPENRDNSENKETDNNDETVFVNDGSFSSTGSDGFSINPLGDGHEMPDQPVTFGDDPFSSRASNASNASERQNYQPVEDEYFDSQDEVTPPFDGSTSAFESEPNAFEDEYQIDREELERVSKAPFSRKVVPPGEGNFTPPFAYETPAGHGGASSANSYTDSYRRDKKGDGEPSFSAIASVKGAPDGRVPVRAAGRAGAYLLNGLIVISAVLIPLIFLFGFILFFAMTNGSAGDLNEGNGLVDLIGFGATLFVALLIVIIRWAFEVPLTVKKGGNIGKLILKQRVVDRVTGSYLSWKAATLRWLIREWLAILGGFASMFLPQYVQNVFSGLNIIWYIILLVTIAVSKPLHTGLHDRLARSIVVQHQ